MNQSMPLSYELVPILSILPRMHNVYNVFLYVVDFGSNSTHRYDTSWFLEKKKLILIFELLLKTLNQILIGF